MAILGVNLQILIGKHIPDPAPAYVAEALESVEIQRSDNGPATFQVVFHVDRTQQAGQNFRLLNSPLLKPANRIILSVILNGFPRVIMDGYIIEQELARESESHASTLTISGQDVSVIMDLVEYSIPYPALGPDAIAWAVLEKYSFLGFHHKITASLYNAFLFLEGVPQQCGTDLNFLQQLAGMQGFRFYIKPGPHPKENTAIWGPPDYSGTPQKTLSVDVGPETNVESIDFKFNVVTPRLYHGLMFASFLPFPLPLPVVTTQTTQSPRLSNESAIPDFDALSLLIPGKTFVHNSQYASSGNSYGQAQAYVQGQTNLTASQAVTVQGKLDVFRYGTILEAPGLVNVRGTGTTYDGTYYVQSVTHNIRRGQYKQNFNLNREGTGSTITEVKP